MKFVHIADMHFDAPFTSLNSKGELGEKRRLEQRSVFRKIIEYIKNNKIKYFFIAGDLYEHEYVQSSTISFISDCFNQIPDTKIFITPGNHDPYIKNSYYDTYEFGENVFVFSNSYVEKYEDENVNIYGMAFTEFYMDENVACVDKINLNDKTKLNILISHCELNGGKDKEGFSYNPVSETSLRNVGFDYVALGHIHKNNLENKNNIFYPGSTISFGFDELGPHGMIVGEITKDNFEMQFVELDDRRFEEIYLDVQKFLSKEDLIEHIQNLNYLDNNLYKIILTGKRNFEIDSREILKVIHSENLLKIKNETKINYDAEEIAKEQNLRGLFVKEVFAMYEKGLCTEEECQRAIEIGLENM